WSSDVCSSDLVDLHAELGREERALLAPDVLAVLDGREDLLVRGRPPDPLLLERLDERGLGEAGRRLGEVLLGIEGEELEDLSLGQGGNHGLLLLFRRRLRILARLDVDGHEAGELL